MFKPTSNFYFFCCLISNLNIFIFRVGALAKYRCERGYKIVGDSLITCDETGTWSGLLPECVCKFFFVIFFFVYLHFLIFFFFYFL